MSLCEEEVLGTDMHKEGHMMMKAQVGVTGLRSHHHELGERLGADSPSEL